MSNGKRKQGQDRYLKMAQEGKYIKKIYFSSSVFYENL